jgi:hypothetical protein
MVNTLIFIYTSLEISLWKNIIPLLSDAHPVGLLVQKIFELYDSRNWIKGAEKVLTWLVLGLGAGFILGVLWGLLQ